MKLSPTGEWIESLSDAELERLQKAFASVATKTEQDRNIAAWIKQVRESKLAVTKMRKKSGYDEWGARL